MKKTFAIIAGTLIIIATIGFLLIQNILEDKICNKYDEKSALISKQKETFKFLEKANYYRELAALAKDNVDILKTLNISNEIIQTKEKNYLSRLKASAMYTINALSSSKVIDNRESEEMIKSLDILAIDEVKKFYFDYVIKAADGNKKLGQAITSNKKSAIKLKKIKGVLWYFCFAFHSLGMFFGLLSMFYKE